MGNDGVVAALRSSTAQHGQIVAASTGRSLVLVDDVEEIASVENLRMIVMPWQGITSKLLHRLYEHPSETPPPGIVSAMSPDRLDRLVAKLLASPSSPRPGHHRIDIAPTLPLGCHTLGERLVCGSKSSTKEVHAALGSGTDLLMISAHSDGIDADLSPAVLCPITNSVRSQDLTCVKRNWCHRRQISIDGINTDKFLISPTTVNAHVLLMLSCFAVVVREGIARAATPLLERILVEGNVRCTFAMWGIGFISRREMDFLANIFQSSRTASAAMLQTQDSDIFREGRIRFALFGDPDAPLPRHINQDSNPQRTVFPPSLSNRYFLESFLKGCRRNERESTRATTYRLANNIERYGVSLEHSDVRASLLDAISAFGTMPIKQWLGDTSALMALPFKHAHCTACGSITICFRTTCFPRNEQRNVTSCPACGIVEDYSTLTGPVSVSSPVNRLVTIHCTLPDSPWEVRLIAEFSKDEPPKTIPIEHINGKLIARLPGDMPPGNIVLSALLVSSSGLSVARREIRLPMENESHRILWNRHLSSPIWSRPRQIETTRLVLRPPRMSDKFDVFSYGSELEVTRYLEWKPLRNLEESEQFLKKSIEDFENKVNGWPWLIEYKKTGRVIGAVRTTTRGNTIEIGFVVSKTHQRRGYGSEAIGKVTSLAHSSGVIVVLAYCDIENIASHKLLEKLGFTRACLLHKHIVHPNIGSSPRDCFLYRHYLLT